ncbi:MAG: hypothetical protein H7A36_01465 [Chlamydiales bacterium]|nr:hypothetical protein [Chlamydiales bacterium]
MMQYAFKVDLHIDQFFLSYDISSPMKFPGRTSLNTSLCFFLESIALFLLTFKVRLVRLSIILLFACIPMGISFVTFIGYTVGYETGIGLDLYSRMALHTALGIFLSGCVVLSWTLFTSIGSAVQLYALPTALSLSIALSTLALWRASTSKTFYFAELHMKRNINEIKKIIDAKLWEDVKAIERMAARWDMLRGYPSDLWEVDSNRYIQDLPGLVGLQIIDKSFKIQKQTSVFHNKILRIDQQYPEQYAAVQEGKNACVYNRNQELFWVMIPIMYKEEFQGVLVGFIDVDTIFENSMALFHEFLYKVIFLQDNHVVFIGNNFHEKSIGAPYEVTIAENFVPFTLQAYLTESALDQATTGSDSAPLVVGLFLALSFGAVAYFGIKARLKESLLEISYRDLKIAKERADNAAVAKGSFLATTTHEIKTPLNTIIGTIQLLTETEVNETQLKYIHRIDLASKSLLNLISDILDYSKIEANALKFENIPFDVVDTLKNACESFAVLSEEKKIPLYLEVPAQPMPKVIGDAHRIEQILLNLINNAFKFTEAGEILVRMKYHETDSSRAVLHFEVIDSGVGIAGDDQAKLFQKFTQVEVSDARKFGGVGLGLSICKGLIEKMQGRIGIVSSQGEGTTLWFEVSFNFLTTDLPLKYSLENYRVLLIHLSAIEEKILSKYFREWGAEVETKSVGSDFPFDLVIAAKGEMEQTENIVKNRAPILYSTAQSARESGRDVLPWPITPKNLWEAVQSKKGT